MSVRVAKVAMVIRFGSNMGWSREGQDGNSVAGRCICVVYVAWARREKIYGRAELGGW